MAILNNRTESIRSRNGKRKERKRNEGWHFVLIDTSTTLEMRIEHPSSHLTMKLLVQRTNHASLNAMVSATDDEQPPPNTHKHTFHPFLSLATSLLILLLLAVQLALALLTSIHFSIGNSFFSPEKVKWCHSIRRRNK